MPAGVLTARPGSSGSGTHSRNTPGWRSKRGPCGGRWKRPPGSGSGPWPCFIYRGDPPRYGLDTPGHGVKVAEHHTGPVVTAGARSFDVEPAGQDRVIGFVRDWLPGLGPRPVSCETCLYTSTPSEDFVVDRYGCLVVAAGFSGHGFKFTPFLGRLIADMAEGRHAAPELFRLSRPAAPRRRAHL